MSDMSAMRMVDAMRTMSAPTSATRTPRAERMRRIARSAIPVLVLAAASIGIAGRSTTARAAQPLPPTAVAPGVWRVTTMEHVDLWLHGFALLTSDTGRVPFFLRSYKQQITALKRDKKAFSLLDANQRDLSQGFARNPALANAQFLAMYFTSFQEIVNATNLFMQSQGNPRAGRDYEMQQELAILASNFRTPADRDWLRLFVQSLQDENDKFYHAYWNGEQQSRNAAYMAFQEAWASKYYPKLSRFLNNTQQGSGQLVLSLPLGGEGRTVNDGKQSNIIAVEYPVSLDAVPNALFAFAHEAVAKLVDEAIADNSTPAQVRSGETAGWIGNGAVRAGALLIQRIAPDLATAYMRYYEKTMGLNAQPNDIAAVFAAAFPLPDALVAALGKQIDVVLGGI